MVKCNLKWALSTNLVHEGDDIYSNAMEAEKVRKYTLNNDNTCKHIHKISLI